VLHCAPQQRWNRLEVSGSMTALEVVHRVSLFGPQRTLGQPAPLSHGRASPPRQGLGNSGIA